ncbi:MAG: 2,3,4,5-tetrahydropyridine-2,6-dicarboxylate N-succinyltransferase, partial [Burkholderiaceae bacterium]|nr:2,3,4,5-tetrahydropyridine-2,6-dicarboxylate N-succinyltransferase [Burkholderiaceae bacterium]
MSQQLQRIIDGAWETRASLTPQTAPAGVRDAVTEVIGLLDNGKLRVAEKQSGNWVVNQWAKKAVLLSFRLEDNTSMPVGSGHTLP